MSATPNSFRETNFNTPDEQRVGAFTTDYTRVGPEIHGNRITGNSLNGLQVRVRTGSTVEAMTVAGRMDDTDIVHLIPENLVIAGTAGGMISDIVTPPATIISLTAQAGGTLAAGKYTYKLTYVDASGNESGVSEATSSITIAANSSIVLQNLPAVRTGSQYIGRRLYRSDATGSGNYILVRELNATSTTVVDNGTAVGSPLITMNAPVVSSVTLALQGVGGLAAGSYTYKVTFVDANGRESNASEATQAIAVAANSAVSIQGLPVIPVGSQFTARRLYRSDLNGGGDYELVQQLPGAGTSFVDNGTQIGTLLTQGSRLSGTRARLDGRLAIDGGTVVKLLGSRIEVQFGAQLIAEGTDERPVIFTSTSDVRYGAGGTFATSSAGQTAARGNWGGIYLGPTAKASLDHAVVAYGGGTTRVEGGFAEFNAIEVQQADLRLANSRLELNAAGNIAASTSDRNGRGTNTEAIVFVRGAQPVIVDNIVANNSAAAFSVNVSALNNTYVVDQGRSTGELGTVVDRLDNQGPLIAGNRLDKNSVNGLVVRGGILTTEGVWDDTDIVHVVRENIEVPNFHTYGGLRLQSGATQSLVVKLLGAGITANGQLIDNYDRIGGSVQLVGTPGNPVLMTSANDCSVGVGFTPDGRPQTDTLNTACGTSFTVSPFADVIVVMDDSGSMTPRSSFHRN